MEEGLNLLEKRKNEIGAEIERIRSLYQFHDLEESTVRDLKELEKRYGSIDKLIKLIENHY